MFDGGPSPALASVADADDAALVGMIAGWARAATQAEALKLAAIAEWHRRRCDDRLRARWACDAWDAAAAEISCALNISGGRASGQMNLALGLRDRFPQLGRLFLAGMVSVSMVTTIVWRTGLVIDEQALAALDTAFAEAVTQWGVLSQKKLEDAIDVWIDKYDPDAVRRLRTKMRGRSFEIGHRDDTTGLTSVSGKLSTTDAALLAERLATMVHSVCDDDPRTMTQRRADAVGAISMGSFVLACRCDNPDCAAGTVDDGRASSVVIHVIADQQSLDADVDAEMNGPQETPENTPPERAECAQTAETRTAAETATEREPAPARRSGGRRTAALIPGLRNGVIPAPLLAELIAHGATVRFVGDPDTLKSVDGYRPSVALAEFVRTRDLTCRLPGCDRPAIHADVDHTQPWPQGATHPSNLKCYCRIHHLIKTFWNGWTDTQSPDGTVTVTTPSGHRYTTKPFSALLFPSWNTSTGPPPRATEPTPPRHPGRALMMPTRRRTREQARADRINRERRLNASQRELDLAAARVAAEERRARREDARRVKPRGPQQASAHRAADCYRSSMSSAPGCEPDYGDDPPPF